MRQNFERYVDPLAISVILTSIVFIYSTGTLDQHYQGEDYLFVSQVNRLGFAKSILLSWKDHFLPLYRIVMGGLHVLFENAIPIRIAILLFHLANTILIYSIVRGRTRSIALATVAGATFGLSRQSASELLFPINGHWVMSLTFVLTMSICFDVFLRSKNSPGLKNPAESGEAEDDTPPTIPNASGSPPTTRDLTDITMQPAVWQLSYYYAGLLCFAIGLSFFTIALAGGAIVWAFMYSHLLREKDFRQNVRLQAKAVIPFVAIIAVYLLMRSHFNELSRPYLDSMTHMVMAQPDVSLSQVLTSIVGLPLKFYASAARQAMPGFNVHYIAILVLLALLLSKEIAFRKRAAGEALMWLGFATASIAMPAFGRMFFVLKGSGDIENLLFPWYFYVPVAGVSIGLGLLLRPPPFLEKKAEEFSPLRRAVLFVLVVAILATLNFNTAKEIKTFIPPLVEENRRFNELLTRYRSSMASFLESPAYSPERQYYFKDRASADTDEFPMSWYVIHHDIFYLYYPDMKNIHFIGGFGHHGDLYFWSPDGITKKQWQGGM
jgi:hypothetical protein